MCLTGGMLPREREPKIPSAKSVIVNSTVFGLTENLLRTGILFACNAGNRTRVARITMSHEPKTYDLIVIGGGPAGLNGVTTACILGKSVALVDRHHELGGAGINTGTVPSKTLRETAVALSGLQSRDLYGVDLSLRREVTIRDFLGHEQHVKAVFNESFLKRLHNEHSDIFFGEASFVD